MKSKATVKMMPQAMPSVATHMREILKELGEDPAREGLLRTPERYEKAMRFLTSGYTTDLEEIVNSATFSQKVD